MHRFQEEREEMEDRHCHEREDTDKRYSHESEHLIDDAVFMVGIMEGHGKCKHKGDNNYDKAV